MKLKNNTQIIVADSEKYLVLRNQGDEDIIDLRVVESGVRDNPPTRAQGTDRPGRFPTPNKQLSAVSNADWHQLEKARSARDLADKLNKLTEKHLPVGTVLVADPKTLGQLRPLLSVTASANLIRVIPKDLTHHTVPDIEGIIKAA